MSDNENESFEEISFELDSDVIRADDNNAVIRNTYRGIEKRLQIDELLANRKLQAILDDDMDFDFDDDDND